MQAERKKWATTTTTTATKKKENVMDCEDTMIQTSHELRAVNKPERDFCPSFLCVWLGCLRCSRCLMWLSSFYCVDFDQSITWSRWRNQMDSCENRLFFMCGKMNNASFINFLLRFRVSVIGNYIYNLRCD